jgi:hypothetical protein
MTLTQGVKPYWSKLRVTLLAFVVVPSHVACPFCTSRVVRDVSSSLVCNKNLSVIICLLCACCMLAGRSRPYLFKKKTDIIHLNIT